MPESSTLTSVYQEAARLCAEVGKRSEPQSFYLLMALYTTPNPTGDFLRAHGIEEDLLLDVWHYQSANVETRTVDIHIVGLRRKVEPEPAKPQLIQTVRGKGYRWYA